MLAAAVSTVTIVVLRRFAASMGLVDAPNHRKVHIGHIPLIGGVAIFAGVLSGAFLYGHFGAFTRLLLATAAMLAVVGMFDDRHDLSVRLRLLIQAGAVLIMTGFTGVYIHTLGHFFGHDIVLGWLGIPFTMIAVIGLLNAFNMMDGIDGLVGSISLISMGAIATFDHQPRLHSAFALMLLLASATIPYMLANLGLFGKKIFMGDAGSVVLGYLLAWILIRLSQDPVSPLSPTNVMWCVALPVLDTLAVMTRRILHGKSPFHPDRGHIHHLMMRRLDPRQTLAALIALDLALVAVGMLLRRLSPAVELAGFVLIAVVYVSVVGRLWRLQQPEQALA
jgi:UDP-GlcNAc:undecaprenyl-phosphate/decaprenyl-phosphate GlcNAc-1-phosphate transferase